MHDTNFIHAFPGQGKNGWGLLNIHDEVKSERTAV